MKHTLALSAALLSVTAAPAFAQSLDDLPMDQNDRAIHEGGSALDAEIQADLAEFGVQGAADISTTVETVVKSTVDGHVDAVTGKPVLVTPDTQVTTEIITEVTPHDHAH